MNPQTNQDGDGDGAQTTVAAVDMPIGQQNPPVPGQEPPLTLPPQLASARVSAPPDSIAPVAEQPMEVVASPHDQDLPSAIQAMPTVPEEAADIDVIEKEWVVQVKQVIAKTKTDPHKQVLELNKVRAEYMKKRYNKDIKLPEA